MYTKYVNYAGFGPYCKGYPNTGCTMTADCSGCYVKYYDTETEEIIDDCELTYGTPDYNSTTSTSEPSTTCLLPPCVNPCSPFENIDILGEGTPFCKGYPNTRCQGYADCSMGYGACYARYFDKDTGLEIDDCELIWSDIEETTTTGCLIDCADPCGISTCEAYPNANCDFTVDCEKGCIPFYTDEDGNVVDCDDMDDMNSTTTAEPLENHAEKYGFIMSLMVMILITFVLV